MRVKNCCKFRKDWFSRFGVKNRQSRPPEKRRVAIKGLIHTSKFNILPILNSDCILLPNTIFMIISCVSGIAYMVLLFVFKKFCCRYVNHVLLSL